MLLQLRDISFQAGTQTILQHISLDIGQGQMLALIGPNGAGKTSLLKIMANINTRYQGHYDYAGKPVRSYPLPTLAHEFGYLAQDATAHWPLKVSSLIALGRLPFQGISRRLSSIDQQAILEAADKTEVSHLMERTVDKLSGGERTRVFLARLLASKPRVIFVDEPVAALDPYHQLHVMEILQQHAREGGTVVIVLHDLNLATRFCDRLALMDKGCVIAEGNRDDLLGSNLLQQTYGIELRTFCEGDAYAITPWQRLADKHP